MLFSLVFSFLITFYLVPLFCELAYKWRFVDTPDGKIKKHDQATPYMGGIAVYCGFLSGLALTMPFDSCVFLLLIGATLLLFIGLIDDLYVLKPYQKFFGQLVVALCFLKAGFYLKEHVFYNVWNMPLSLLWILTVINSFNLVDVMDGLATTLAGCATLSLLLIAIYLNNATVMVLLCAFLGALLAFLWYNRPPAKIYLGDAGSLFIGGVLAVVPFLLNWGTYNQLGYLSPLIVLAIPLLECCTLIVVRRYKGIPFYQGSPDHFACYLLGAGWSKQHILYYVMLLSGYAGLVAILFTAGILSFAPTALLGLIFMGIWGFILIKK